MTTTSLFPKGAQMYKRFLCVLATTLLVGACNVLDTVPPDTINDDQAVTTPAGARAGLAGAYSQLQDGFYYGGTMTHFGDLYADNANHTGTFTSYQDAVLHQFFSNNSDVTGMWDNIYDAIKRANTLLARVMEPGLSGSARGTSRMGTPPKCLTRLW